MLSLNGQPIGDRRLLGLLGEGRRRDERRRCENSLIEFLICAWPHLGEAGELDINWHHEVIADHLEGMARGEIRNLVLNQPPRTTKSLLCSAAFPAWLWCQPEDRRGPLMGPQVRFLCISYGATLAEEIAVKMRRLVLGEWYQGHWGDRVQIREDQSNRANFGNKAGGERISNSIEGGILGRGGDLQIIDDPHHIKGAESDTQRRETLEGMRSLVTRVTDPRKSARLLVMQRLHEDDATNYALSNWVQVKHLMFPMRLDLGRAIAEDIRSEDRELLWPRVWDEQSVRQEEKELGEYGASGQLQQAPVPRGGGIIKRGWWRLWPDDAEGEAEVAAEYGCRFCGWLQQFRERVGTSVECANCGRQAERVVRYPATSYRMLSVDTAYSEADQVKNSWNAITSWGVWHGKDERPLVMLRKAWRGRPPLRGGNTGEKGLVEVVHEMAVEEQVDLVLIEKKTRGVDLFQELERLLRDYPYQLGYFEPTGRGDKVARLTAVQSLFTNDLVWAPDKAWAEMVIDEICSQPRAQFGDLADTCSAALLYLRDNNLLSLKHEHDAERRRAMVFKSARGSVAEQYEEA